MKTHRLKTASMFAFKSTGIFLALLCTILTEQAVSAAAFQSDKIRRTEQKSEVEAKRKKEASDDPSDISFAIRLTGDKKRFRQGEIIALELSFASSRAKTYRLDAATYDRSGRLHLDEFTIEPEAGFADPLHDHFSPFGFYSMGGLRGIAELEEKPYLIHYDLNEWFRFDRPGKYRLYLTSPRVSRIKKGNEPDSITLTSNAVEFEIVQAERDWPEKELQRITRELDAKDRKTDLRSPCRALRFLGSKAAAVELARRLGDPDSDCAFEYYVGLIGSPHRSLVIETLEKRMAMPDQPVSNGWLSLMIKLAMVSNQDLPLPSSNDEQRQEYWQRYQALYGQLQEKFAGTLAQSIQQKTGRAKAISINTLLELNRERANLPDVSSFFNDLPAPQQRTLLEGRWRQIASDSMLPILRQLYAKGTKTNPERYSDAAEVTTLALKRLYELSPEEGRKLILAEMKRPAPRVRLAALTVLPDETLPELDDIFVDNFKNGGRSDTYSALIERYGSPNVFARVHAILDQQVGKMACYEQSKLLGYCLRVDSPGSIELVRRAVTARGKEDTRCYPSTLREVAELHTSPELEKLAVEFLDDADPEVVIDAVAMLGQNGSAEAEDALWRRLEKWHEEWAGQEQKLKANIYGDDPIHLQTGLEQALRSAIGGSPAWLADPKKLERLKQLCVTPNERQQVDHWIQEWGGEIQIRFAPEDDKWGRAEVAQYSLQSLPALKEKLSQFPAGTVFKWQPYNQGHLEEEKEKLFRELEFSLNERGSKLIR